MREFGHTPNATRFVTATRVYYAIRYARTKFWALTWKAREAYEKEEAKAFGVGRSIILRGSYSADSTNGQGEVDDLFAGLDHVKATILAYERAHETERAGRRRKAEESLDTQESAVVDAAQNSENAAYE